MPLSGLGGLRSCALALVGLAASAAAPGHGLVPQGGVSRTATAALSSFTGRPNGTSSAAHRRCRRRGHRGHPTHAGIRSELLTRGPSPSSTPLVSLRKMGVSKHPAPKDTSGERAWPTCPELSLARAKRTTAKRASVDRIRGARPVGETSRVICRVCLRCFAARGVQWASSNPAGATSPWPCAATATTCSECGHSVSRPRRGGHRLDVDARHG